jgi:serine/threonine protein kinase
LDDLISDYCVTSELDVPAGTIVDERFEITGFLGQGGMCTVYEAQHTQLQRRVALKVMHAGSISTGDAFPRFQREAILASEVKHPNIIEIHGFGIWNGRPYIAMEYVEGRTLAQIIDDTGPMSEERTLGILLQICAALAQAHASRVVHRDLKPSNVIITAGDQIKLVDFGIARLLPESGEEMQRLTQTGQVLGTFVYMSPEQCTGRPVDARADLYAFGGLMYKMLTGMPPFAGDSPFELMAQHMGEPPRAMPGISNRMQNIARWCLQKDPSLRPQSAADLKDALLGDDLNITQSLNVVSAKPKKRVISKIQIAAASVCLVVVAGAAAMLLHHSPEMAPPAPPPTAEELRLLEAVRQAEKSSLPRGIAMANLDLCKYYDAASQWRQAEAAGHAALNAFEQTKEDSFKDALWAKYYVAVAQQNDGKIGSAILPFYRIAKKLADAPPDLKQLCALHSAECCIELTKNMHADEGFQAALSYGDLDGPGVLQQIRLEYAQFLSTGPQPEEGDWDNNQAGHSRGTLPDAAKQRRKARDLCNAIIAAGAKTPEDQKRLDAAKNLLRTLQ